MKPKLKNKYLLPSDQIGDDLPWWHEIVRLTLFAVAIAAAAFALMGAGR